MGPGKLLIFDHLSALRREPYVQQNYCKKHQAVVDEYRGDPNRFEAKTAHNIDYNEGIDMPYEDEDMHSEYADLIECMSCL